MPSSTSTISTISQKTHPSPYKAVAMIEAALNELHSLN
jgi:hypothetical protein